MQTTFFLVAESGKRERQQSGPTRLDEVIASHQDKVSSGELEFLNTIEKPLSAL